ncbi:MAG: 3-hydroxyacyl-ACP dehydratase FabZ [Clostridiales Family XIII bacterium]|jgi:3-hydroxyacyl-[acyl-carrier-protein] dehydratase|nr:3-hydroxyacyl-ACP dehydratase FabZ [Clostridiales Family XIII bacterium]
MDVLMGKEKIKKIIPHREPMLLVDEVLEMTAGERIRTRLSLKPDMMFFKGHFPDAPVLPGVLTVEAMAQTADILLLSMECYAGLTPLFIGIDKVSFKKKLEPGDVPEITAYVIRINEPKAVVTCGAEVFCDGGIVATGEVTLAMR